jgi:iron transport multicopper oxidase
MVTSRLILSAPLLALANAAVLEHWWNISYATANPDGVGFMSESRRR